MRTIKNVLWSGYWAVGVKCWSRIYIPLPNSIGWTRSNAIESYKKTNVLRTDTYEQRRRKGELKAIRLYVEDTRGEK